MRARLVLLVAATTSLVIVAFLVPLAMLLRTAAADRAVSGAVGELQALVPVVATVDRGTLALSVQRANSTGQHPVTVFLPDGTVIGAPAPRSEATRLAATGRSLTAEAAGGREVLIAVAGLPGGTAVIRTFVTGAELHAGVARAWAVLGLLGSGLLGLSLLVADQLARALTRPLAAAAGAAHRLADGDLDVRVEVDGPPEVKAVGSGLNLLAGRIERLLADERETVAELSHRLRTPLTALRIDAEALPDHADRARITADVDQVERMVNEVIRRARRPAREGVSPACDAAAVVADRLAFWSALAEEEEREVGADVPPYPVPVGVDGDDLAACADALLGNVFAHTPEGTAFAVSLVARESGGAVLTVADAGSGMPAPDLLVRGTSGGDSTGLGLDIVRGAALRSGGDVTVGVSAAGGAQVSAEFGPPAVGVDLAPS